MMNMPEVKLGIVAVSRDCFPITLSESRRKAVAAAYKGELYECPTVVESELDMQKALKEVQEAGCNALVVYLGNFGPETAETLLVIIFDVTWLAVTAGMTLIFRGRLDGLGIGTVLAAFTMGKTVGIIGNMMDKKFRFVSFLSK